ncbi:MAG TPA: hypothetical protein ENJ50_10145, partial [Planctomycetaceae bacterium]|nr:hypothetical protein [Planctomycetaceae bacterium]
MSRSDRLDALMQRWEEELRHGVTLSAEELCRDDPDLIDDVRDIVEAFDGFETREVRVSGRRESHDVMATADAVRLLDSLCATSRFRDVRLLAKGGLGVVCTAHDEQLHRDVAVKFLRENLVDVAEFQERFMAEAEITGRLEHPGVVPVHGIGRAEDGRRFYVMRLIRGQTLEDAIGQYHRRAKGANDAERRAEFVRLLGCLVSVCQTVAYAHSRGIV